MIFRIAGAPEKPSRLLPAKGLQQKVSVTHNSTQAALPRKQRLPPAYLSWEQLIQDDTFLAKFFLYFSPCERCMLARVCTRWRDVLYRSPRYWSGLVPALQCRELRSCQGNERARLYSSLLRRGFHNLCLLGAADEDVMDLVNTFPLASKHIHALSLRCSSITDRGLETLLDHLQVRCLFPILLLGTKNVICLQSKKILHDKSFLLNKNVFQLQDTYKGRIF